MSKLRFTKQLPVPGRAGRINVKHDWGAIAKECRAHAGQWADVFQLGANTSATYYYLIFKRGRALGLEVTTSRQNGKVHVYMRWPK